jgi:small conductance mechanosensitive channel
VAIENEVVETTDVVERLSPAIQRIQNRVNQFVAFTPLIGIALFAGALTMWIGFFIARRNWPWDRMAPNAFIADIYRQVVRLAVHRLGLVLALDLLNATALLSTILGAAGIVGLGDRFRRARHGGKLHLVDHAVDPATVPSQGPGRDRRRSRHVIRLTSRATILLSLDGNHIRIPNSTVFKSKIVNYSRNDERRVAFTLGIDPGADIAAAQDIVLAALGELPFLLETPGARRSGSKVWATAPSTSRRRAGSSNSTRPSIGMAKGEAIRVVKARLEEAGIGLPEPTYRLIGAGVPPRMSGAVPKPAAPAAPTTPAMPTLAATETRALEDIIGPSEGTENEDLLRRAASRSDGRRAAFFAWRRSGQSAGEAPHGIAKR